MLKGGNTMNNEQTIDLIAIGLIGLLLANFMLAGASTIEFQYPQNNTTTEIYYATDVNHNYIFTKTNSLSDANYTSVIIKDSVNTDSSLDVVSHPETLLSKLAPLVLFIVVVFMIILFAYLIKRVLL